jgi:peptidoglycan/LPS O-acetylase OafA/YrhL
MKRIPQLDGLRGIAILMVFLFHALQVPVFWSGVDLFFVLSGYLITGILLRLKEQKAGGVSGLCLSRSFYVRRAFRIIPPFIGFLGVLTLFFHVPWRHIWYWYAFFDANFASATHHDVVRPMVPLWSLAVEEQFYFVWPWVVLSASPKTLKRIALGIVLTAPVLRAIFTPAFSSQWPIYALTPFRADTLACGALIALLTQEDTAWFDRNHRRAVWFTSAAGAIFVMLSALHSFRWTANTVLFNTLGYSLIVAIFGGALVWVLGSQGGIVYSILRTKPLRYLGLISYTFYLYHLGVLILLKQSAHISLLVYPLSFAITVAIAAISWRFFETPILRMSRLLEAQTGDRITSPHVAVVWRKAA